MSSLRLLLALAVMAIMLIAPVMVVKLALARPPLAAAAHAYDADAACTSQAERGLPSPARPIPDALRRGAPCSLDGAMVTDKDTISTGPAGVTRYAFGLRSDSGAESVATLAGGRAAELWNATQAGDRVVVQTVAGRVALVGDGSRTVPTDANPESAAGDNKFALWITGVLCALEMLALAIFITVRRRARSNVQSVEA
jgi:hypothetical protein